MFQNILVPLDGSTLSEAALGAAAAMARKFGSSVTLLHVIEKDPPPEVHKEPHLTGGRDARIYLEQTAVGKFPTTSRVETHVHEAPVEDVARSIAAHATSEFEPDLIVMCTHGRSGMRNLLFGSIAQQVVAQGTTPLLLIKPDSPAFQVRRILVPLDPDSEHDDALPAAEALARAFEAEIDFISIIPTYGTLTGEAGATSSLMPATTQAMLELREEHARDHLRLHADGLSRDGVRCSTGVERGDPASGILRSAERQDIDLIVLSTHRKAGLGAFWSRSVAPKVAERTRVPVLLIPLP